MFHHYFEGLLRLDVLSYFELFASGTSRRADAGALIRIGAKPSLTASRV